MRFAIPVPPGTTYSASPISRAVSISPDGTRLVIEVVSKGRSRLYLRPLDSEEAVELEGSLDATVPFWSPDSRFIAFFAGGRLKKIPASGGHPEELCDAPFAIVGTWSREGTILFSRLAPPGIYRVSDQGGQAVRVISPDPSPLEVNVLWPHFLPDGRRFLYFVNPPQTTEPRELRLSSLDSNETHTVARLDSRAEYVAPGYLIFVREGYLYAQRFDDAKAELHGDAQVLAQDVHYHLGPSNAAFSVSQAGVLAYETAQPPSRLIWLDREGRELGQLGQPSVVQGVRISPDGGRALPVALGPPLDVGAPRPLFRGEPDIENYDVVPDGSRFLISTPAQKVRESPIRVIVNWTAALEKER